MNMNCIINILGIAWICLIYVTGAWTGYLNVSVTLSLFISLGFVINNRSRKLQ